jgi:hypothetical protein
MTALLISHIAPGTPQWVYVAAITGLFLHIAGGFVGVGAGFVAIMAKKGGRLHARAGTVFFAAMLALGGMGLALAIFLKQTGNIAGGTLVLYLATTAWLAARRRDGKPGVAEIIACTAIAVLAVALFFVGMHPGSEDKANGMVPMYFVFSAFATFAAVLDLRMLWRGGVSGTQRIMRHLWRMGAVFFFASASLFIGQQQVLPEAVQGSPVLYVLAFAPLALMLFWLVKIRFVRRREAVAI